MKLQQKLNNQRGDGEIIIFAFVAIAILIIVVLSMWLWPKYNIYAQRAEGQAMLAHAQSAKEVAVAEAKAKMESAELLAQAEVARAKGVAAANQIIGESLKGNESYLRYLWVTEVAGKDVDKVVVYIPTESNMPLMEAGRLKDISPERK